MGAGVDGFLSECKGVFEKTKVIRPEATRERSYEHYVVGLALRAEARLRPDETTA